MTSRWTRIGWLAGLTALAAGLAATPAVAVDGVLEIDQACIAIGCFPGDAPGFPVEITPASAGGGASYRLTSNLEVPDDDTTAILGSSEFVSIDLNGFSILGQYSCSSGSPPTCPGGSARAIDFPAGRAVHVRNGGIRNFGSDAVRVPAGSVVEKLRIDFVRGNGIVVGLGSIVSGNALVGIGEDGIQLTTAGGAPVGGLVENNVIRSVGGDGVQAGPASLVGNVITFVGDENARLSNAGAYGQNKFDAAPNGGNSTGNNVCGNITC